MKKTSLIAVGIALVVAATVLVRDTHKTYIPAAAPTIATTATTAAATTSETVPARVTTPAVFAQPAPQAPAAAVQNNVTLTAGVHTYGANISGNDNVLDLMRTISSTTDFKFTGQDYPSLGYFVESINGMKNADGKYWILYINGKSSDLGASQAIINSGDSVEWRFESSY